MVKGNLTLQVEHRDYANHQVTKIHYL